MVGTILLAGKPFGVEDFIIILFLLLLLYFICGRSPIFLGAFLGALLVTLGGVVVALRPRESCALGCLLGAAIGWIVKQRMDERLQPVVPETEMPREHVSKSERPTV